MSKLKLNRKQIYAKYKKAHKPATETKSLKEELRKIFRRYSKVVDICWQPVSIPPEIEFLENELVRLSLNYEKPIQTMSIRPRYLPLDTLMIDKYIKYMKDIYNIKE